MEENEMLTPSDHGSSAAASQRSEEDLRAENKRLRGTLKYIATQAAAGHPNALAVIRANANAALDEDLQKEIPRGAS